MAGILNKLIGSFSKREYSPFCTAVVAAAGASRRMDGENKIFSQLCGVPVIAHTLIALQNSEYINEIVIVTRENEITSVADVCAAYNIEKTTKIVCGGTERSDSVMAGIAEASPKAKYVAIHDGARPLLTQNIIKDTVFAAIKFNAAVPAIKINDTVKIADNNTVINTIDRSKLYAVQTPQVFKTELIKAALYNAKEKNIAITDDSMAVELMGASVYLTKGSTENIKITTPVDLVIAEALLKKRG